MIIPWSIRKDRNLKNVTKITLRGTLLTACLAAFCAVLLCGCKKEQETEKQITAASQLNDPSVTIGVAISTPEEKVLAELFPKAKAEYYRDIFLAFENVKSGNADAVVYNRIQMELTLANGMEGVRLLDENIGEGDHIALGISSVSKIPDLKKQTDAFLKQIKEDGTLDDLVHRWTVLHDYTMPDIPEPAHPDKKLVVGTVGTAEPFTFYQGTTLTGSDIELSRRLALWLNAELSFKIYDYTGIISAAKSGDVDLIAANLYVTDEKKEEMLFSDELYVQPVTAMVRDYAAVSKESLFESVKSGFEKTFIRENRWELFADGILTTMIITVLSFLFGTLFGFLVYLLCRNGNGIAKRITAVSIRLVEGMPVIVLLMIFYYVIFQDTGISATIVAIISFSLIFAAAVYGMLKTAVSSIDKGQTEAAYALGYSPVRTFVRIILPQAVRMVLPTYRSEVLSLIKATAIVGYIAVSDLTKVGDIIRSRTYEAFFPLIAVAILYYALGALLTALVNLLIRCLNAKRRNNDRILKGIKHD